jgi:tetratricopeptide (TPR) repeat protein
MTQIGSTTDLAALTAALSAEPRNRTLRARLAERLDRLGRFDEALAVLDEGLAQAPDASDLLILRMLALRHAGRIGAASHVLAALATHNPSHARLPELRGILADASGDAATALRLFAEDAASHPRDVARRLRWLRALARQRGPEEALAALDAGPSEAPTDSPDLLAERAHLLRQADRLAEARDAVVHLARRHPGHPRLSRLRGELAEACGDNVEAAHHYAAELAVQPHDRALRGRLAERLDRLGRYDEALACLEEGLSVSPAAAELLILRMLALHHAGRHEASARALADLAAHHPEHPRLPELRGILAEASGESDTAIRLWAADVAAHPRDAGRRLRWVRGLERRGA